MNNANKIGLLFCKSAKYLSTKIISTLLNLNQEKNQSKNTNFQELESEEIWFSNGEVKTITKNKNIKEVYIIQCFNDPSSKRSINDNILALLTAADSVYQSSKAKINLVLPQYPYSRQERNLEGESITAKIIANLIEQVRVNKIITVDIHSQAIAGFFHNSHFESLEPHDILANNFKNSFPQNNLIVLSPDVGSIKRARTYAKILKTKYAIMDKIRDYSKPGKIENMNLIGEVKGKNILITDDIIASGETIINAARILKEKATKNIYISASFTFFNGNAINNFEKAYNEKIITKVIGTDLVHRNKNFIEKHKWYEEYSLATLIANKIYNS